MPRLQPFSFAVKCLLRIECPDYSTSPLPPMDKTVQGRVYKLRFLKVERVLHRVVVTVSLPINPVDLLQNRLLHDRYS